MGEIRDIINIKRNEKARAYLANFLVEGSHASYQSRQRSIDYLTNNEKDERIPIWVWGGFFISLGGVIFYFIGGALSGVPIF
jgi:hypothetical protein